MNRHQQISAMLDGELSEAEFKALMDTADEADIQAWGSYSMVGDLIRSSELASFHSGSLLKSIEARLAEEPVVLAPVLATQARRKGLADRLLANGRTRYIAASVAAVGLVSFALNQAVPPLDGKVQMVRGQSVESTVTDEELALWQDYFMAHQQNIIRGGLGGVAPLARVEADRPLIDNREHLILGNPGAGEWMNVWEPAFESAEAPVQYNFVSTGR
ncbi:MAG TPA: sigma-E factor negative regulatory protein [Limnobacter sp.]|nr:sigma-E factor negative regulatory protein [Limnobacter sp.]